MSIRLEINEYSNKQWINRVVIRCIESELSASNCVVIYNNRCRHNCYYIIVNKKNQTNVIIKICEKK